MKKEQKDKLKKVTAGVVAIALALTMILSVLAPLILAMNQ